MTVKLHLNNIIFQQYYLNKTISSPTDTGNFTRHHTDGETSLTERMNNFLQRKDTVQQVMNLSLCTYKQLNGPSTWDFFCVCVITECQEIEHVWSIREELKE